MSSFRIQGDCRESKSTTAFTKSRADDFVTFQESAVSTDQPFGQLID